MELRNLIYLAIRAFKITKKDDSSVQIIPAAVQDFPTVNK